MTTTAAANELCRCGRTVPECPLHFVDSAEVQVAHAANQAWLAENEWRVNEALANFRDRRGGWRRFQA